jgi:hypothetical protein
MREKDHYLILIDLITKLKYNKIAEIGVFQGDLSYRVLDSYASHVIQEYYAIDPWLALKDHDYQWRGKTQEDWDKVYLKVCKWMPYFSPLRVIRASSEAASKLFWKNYFDLVYIDGLHNFDSVTKDIEMWLPLVRKGGILAGHDYGSVDKNISPYSEVKKAVDNYFGEENILVEDYTVWIKKV